MTDLAAKYAIPPEVMQFVEDGLLVVGRENDGEKTVAGEHSASVN